MIRGQRRPGIATLELVFVFPMLLGMAAAMFLLGRGIVRKESVASSARSEAWRLRAQADPGLIFRIDHDPMTSEVHKHQTKVVGMAPLFRGTNLQAESRNLVLGGLWNVDNVPFQAGQPAFQVHQTELKQIADNLPVIAYIVGGAVQAFALAMKPFTTGLPNRGVYLGVNGAIIAAGWVLETVYAPILDWAIGPLRWLKRGVSLFNRSLARKYQRIIDLMDLGINVFHNLYEASEGRPGVWFGDIVDRLRRAKP